MLAVPAGGSYFIGGQAVKASANPVTSEQTMEMYRGSWESEGFEWEPFAEKYIIEEKSLVFDFDGHTLPFDVIAAEDNPNL